MRILSWNVNGIRAISKKGFIDWLRKESPDILCNKGKSSKDLSKTERNLMNNSLRIELIN